MSRERKNNLFKSVPVLNVRRNLFDLSHEVKMSGKFGLLYPIMCIDTLPGDQFSDTSNVMLRFAPLLAPIMHRIDVKVHFFFVPNRLLSDHWEDFITGGQDGTASPVLPYVTPAGLVSAGAQSRMAFDTIWGYLGLPEAPDDMDDWSLEQISALPFRACAKVWNDYYRDPNFDTEIDLDLEVQGNVSTSANMHRAMDLGLYRKSWEKDYFTSALANSQRGAEVLMPLAGTGFVTYKDVADVVLDGGALPSGTDALQSVDGAFTVGAEGAGTVKNIQDVVLDESSITINDFRRAIAVQRWLEANARGGARYTEQLLQHFNEQVPDYRLQRAEYLGGGSQPVQISEVLATAEGTGTDVGDMAGHGISVGSTNRFSYRCREHGFVIGFLSVVPRTAYFQGVPKMFQRVSKFDYAWPELANLGEQEIRSKELYFSFDQNQQEEDNEVFGYIPRYAEYKFHNDRVAGAFQNTLRYWHLARIFTQRPSLDTQLTSMIENNGASEETYRRIFAVQDGTDYLWIQIYHHLRARRPLPYFGVPSGLS